MSINKALMPLPEKFHGLKDIEQKYRQRYLDLITSSKTIEIFKTRTKILKLIRNYFDNEGFFEFETPMLTLFLAVLMPNLFNLS